MADGFEHDNITLARYVGQTVTIFTTSGGLSGGGFTGVLMSVNDCFVRLLTKVGAAPDCPVGSNCGIPGGVRGIGACGGVGYGPGYGFGPGIGAGYGAGGYGYGGAGNYFGFNGLGAVVVIPVDRIASFVHNAI